MTKRSWLISAVLGVALIVLLVVDLVSLPQRRGNPGSAPVIAARAEAVNFFTLSYEHIDADLANVVSLAADPFKKQFVAKQATIKQGVVAGKLTSTATVADGSAAVEFETASKVIVIVAVDDTTTAPKTSTAKAASETDRYRMRLTVERSAGKWLVSSIEQVG